MENGAGLGARDECSVRVVGAVCERLGNSPKPGFLSEAQDFGTGEAKDRKVGVNRFHGVHDGARLGCVLDDRVVEAAVGLHVLDAGPGGGGQRLQSTDLVDHVVCQFNLGSMSMKRRPNPARSR
jgi:hypothetical protein